MEFIVVKNGLVDPGSCKLEISSTANKSPVNIALQLDA